MPVTRVNRWILTYYRCLGIKIHSQKSGVKSEELVVERSSLLTPCLSHIHHVVHIGQSPLDAFCPYSRVVRLLLIFDIDLLSHFWRRLRGSPDPQCGFRGILRHHFLLGLKPLCSSVGLSEFVFPQCPIGGLLCSSVGFTSFHSLFTLFFHSGVHIAYTRELYQRGAYLYTLIWSSVFVISQKLLLTRWRPLNEPLVDSWMAVGNQSSGIEEQ